MLLISSRVEELFCGNVMGWDQGKLVLGLDFTFLFF